MKKNLADLETHQDLLLYLIESLQSSDAHRVEQLLELIQSDETPQHVAAVLKVKIANLRRQRDDGVAMSDNSRRSPNQSSSSRSNTGASSSDDGRHKWLMSFDVLADVPLVSVPARPWTSLTNDDKFVSHLISLYTSRIQQPFSIIDLDPFLAAMRQQDLDTHLCSPLLVNSILALACVRAPLIYL